MLRFAILQESVPHQRMVQRGVMMTALPGCTAQGRGTKVFCPVPKAHLALLARRAASHVILEHSNCRVQIEQEVSPAWSATPENTLIILEPPHVLAAP